MYRNAGVNCYPVNLADFPSLRESLRHEFHGAQASLELSWSDGKKLIAFWPEWEGDEPERNPQGYFFLQAANGQQPKSVVEVRRQYPRLGIVPILTPLEHTETVLSEDYVRSVVSTRLSSRHFRNHLFSLLKEERWDDFRAFAEPWLPGIDIVRLDWYEAQRAEVLDLFLREQGSRFPKEAIWAGDGIQIWLQILYHLFRLQGYQTVVLDEPDVYLHADLQRRLVQLLESTGQQTIIATHSAEIAAETPRSRMIWVDKNRRSAVAIKDEALLDKLTGALGSNFNLKLAKAMRSRVLLLVEGKDMQILSRITRTLGAEHVTRQDGVSVVSILGYSRKGQIAPFKWILSDLLQDSVVCFVVLDRDYRPQTAVDALESQLRSIGVQPHVWRRKELESYLLHPEAISRLSGAAAEEVRRILVEEATDMENEIFSRMLDEKIAFERGEKNHRVTVTAAFKREFDAMWRSEEWRLNVAPPKDLISALNRGLKRRNHKTISAERLAATLRPDEIPSELRGVVMKVERAAMPE
ncbi:ATP-dependent nuclease [Micromonospora chalcea]|uniref:ATP-dependent nuclease n=1 Tax=Micromonospora chalcea TaxID=1874 RepID=UPI00381E2DE9